MVQDIKEIIVKGRIRSSSNNILTPEIAAKLGAAHGSFIGKNGNLIIAREYNNDCRMLKRAYISGVMSAGVQIMNIHSTPLPLLQFCIRKFGASGGVYFSSGTSKEGEVAIRLFDSSGCEFNEANLSSINELYSQDKIRRVPSKDIGSISNIDHASEIYSKALPQLINKNLFTEKELKVVLDCSHGPAGVITPSLLNDLHINTIALNTFVQISNKTFPNLASIKSAVSIVQASNANLGVIMDPDGSRALYIDDHGNIISFSELMMLFISEFSPFKISKNNPIVISNTASKIIDTYAAQMGYKIKRVENDPGMISRTIREEHSSFGAADTFKFYFPHYGPYSDATFTILMILQILATSNEPLSSILRTFPRTIRTSKTIMISGDSQTAMIKIRDKLREKGYKMEDMIYGVKVIKPKKWVIISQSIFQNAIILNCESEESDGGKDIIAELEELVKDALK